MRPWKAETFKFSTGKVTGLCKNGHRHQEFLAFLKYVARAYPNRQLHLVMDNYAAHKRVEIRVWLAANPGSTSTSPPTSGSLLNLVEVWFGIIERQAIRRGSFTSVHDLTIKFVVHHRLEHPQAPVHLDQARQRDPRQDQPQNLNMAQRHATRRVESCVTGRCAGAEE